MAISLKKLIIKFIVGFIFLLYIANDDLVDYGIRMGRGQLRILTQSRKIDKYLDDPTYPDSLKNKIRLIQEIKKFTVDQLGFQPSPNYNKMFDQKGKPMMYVVTGSEKYALKPMMWSFPIVGKVSYKGFFTKAEADAEARRIEKLGYESRIRIVNAWSTLGWFHDPIMSSMLEDPPGELAELIIHELSHGTIFIKNNVDLSENLANFIGDKGAILFLEYKYGKDSKEYNDYLHAKMDYDKFSSHFIKSAQQMDSLYATTSFKLADSLVKDSIKHYFILQMTEAIDTMFFYEPQFYHHRFDEILPNNASFIVFRQYNSMQDDFENEYQQEAGGDLKKYISYLINKYN